VHYEGAAERTPVAGGVRAPTTDAPPPGDADDTPAYSDGDQSGWLGDVPRPGLVLAFDGEAAPLVGCVVERTRRFGRSDEADVVLEDSSVSRVHMIVEPAPGGVMVRDAGSRNGTWVDRMPADATPRLAPFGSTIRAGRMVFLVREDISPFLGSVDTRDARLVGGPSLAEVRRRIDLAKGSPLAVLVEGETGAGKEVVAGCIHAASGRTGELVEVNCAAIPPELVESELFGHARGAFSGSDRARTGLFRTADGGTLLLDEIGELPGALQAKLLRVLETGEVRPVGEDRAVTVDVRVIAATNRSLDELASRGAFREDLLYRIAALRIAVPPLRDRLEDLPALALHFLAGSGVDIAPRAMEVLLRHRWPGNARQLRNLLAAAVATTRAAGRNVIGAGDVSALLATASVGEQDDGRARILDALANSGGNVTQAARDLGVARSGLYETLRRLAVDPSAFRPARGGRDPVTRSSAPPSAPPSVGDIYAVSGPSSATFGSTRR
jgi:MoxR-like ATPase